MPIILRNSQLIIVIKVYELSGDHTNVGASIGLCTLLRNRQVARAILQVELLLQLLKESLLSFKLDLQLLLFLDKVHRSRFFRYLFFEFGHHGFVLEIRFFWRSLGVTIDHMGDIFNHTRFSISC